MDKILNRICSIDDHPIMQLDEKFRVQYVEGLTACMYSISKGSDISKMMTLAWVQSICSTHQNLGSLWRNDIKTIKNAISLKRKGMKFFYMRESFFFDVFYLAQASMLENTDLNKIFEYLCLNVCGFFSKKSLNKILAAYKQKALNIDGVSLAQITHRNINDKVLSCAEKRVLVVANVSAGKSTLINALVGYRLNKTMSTACTDKLVFIHNKCLSDGITSKSTDGEYAYNSKINEVNSASFIEAALPFNSTLEKKHICFIDTPGINNADDSTHKQITEEAIKKGNYDAVLYVSNCQYFGTNDEYKLINFLKAYVKKPILFVLNQLDAFNPEEDSICKMLNDYKKDLTNFGFKNPVVIPVSGYASFLVRLESSCLTKIERIRKKNIIELFEDRYYNLPQYIGQGFSSEILDKTGIRVLENKLIAV